MMTSEEVDLSDVRLWRIPTVSGKTVSGNALGDIPNSNAQNQPMTAKELASVRDEAYKEGYESGMADGRKRGQELAHKEAQEQNQILQKRMQAQFEAILDTLQNPLAKREEEAEEALAELATIIAKHLVRRELHLDPGEVVAVVRDAVSLLPITRQTVQIRLHPEDAAFVKKVFVMDERANREWQIAEDPSLKRGDAKITTEDSTIDASLDSRVASIVAHLLGGSRDDDDSANPKTL